MDLEINIKVPLGAAVSVREENPDVVGADATGGAVPPAIAQTDAEAPGSHEGDGAGPALNGSSPEPPSLAALGIPTGPSAAETEPPPPELIERAVTKAATREGPPPLEQLSPEAVAGAMDAAAVPPDLPPMAELPSPPEEFTPPSVDELLPEAHRSAEESGGGTHRN